jgi:hypothetical protein
LIGKNHESRLRKALQATTAQARCVSDPIRADGNRYSTLLLQEGFAWYEVIRDGKTLSAPRPDRDFIQRLGDHLSRIQRRRKPSDRRLLGRERGAAAPIVGSRINGGDDYFSRS